MLVIALKIAKTQLKLIQANRAGLIKIVYNEAIF